MHANHRQSHSRLRPERPHDTAGLSYEAVPACLSERAWRTRHSPMHSCVRSTEEGCVITNESEQTAQLAVLAVVRLRRRSIVAIILKRRSPERSPQGRSDADVAAHQATRDASDCSASSRFADHMRRVSRMAPSAPTATTNGARVDTGRLTRTWVSSSPTEATANSMSQGLRPALPVQEFTCLARGPGYEMHHSYVVSRNPMPKQEDPMITRTAPHHSRRDESSGQSTRELPACGQPAWRQPCRLQRCQCLRYSRFAREGQRTMSHTQDHLPTTNPDYGSRRTPQVRAVRRSVRLLRRLLGLAACATLLAGCATASGTSERKTAGASGQPLAEEAGALTGADDGRDATGTDRTANDATPTESAVSRTDGVPLPTSKPGLSPHEPHRASDWILPHAPFYVDCRGGDCPVVMAPVLDREERDQEPEPPAIPPWPWLVAWYLIAKQPADRRPYGQRNRCRCRDHRRRQHWLDGLTRWTSIFSLGDGDSWPNQDSQDNDIDAYPSN